MKNLIKINEFLIEGVNDQGILKAFFMAGGPGSGKSFVASELFGFQEGIAGNVSYRTGLKLVNNDNAFEQYLKKAGLSPSKLAEYAKDEEKWIKVMSLRNNAKSLTKRLQNNYIGGRLGQVIDGTGKNYKKIEGHRNLYQDFGYDTYMIFVNTSIEVALERNASRERVLPESIVEIMWKEVQDNLGKFQRLFGSTKMIIIDNSDYDTSEKILQNVEKQIMRRIKTPVENHLGRKWIEEEKKKRKN